MKLKIIFSGLLITFSISVFAQSPLDSINWKQFSIGYNVLRPFTQNETAFELPILSLKYRTNSHAFVISYSSYTQSHDYSNSYNGFPNYINSNDSSLIIRCNSTFKTGGAFNLCYEKYQNMEHNHNVEFFVGAGLTAGYTRIQKGYNDVTYQKDTTGILMMNDSISHIYHDATIGNYRTFRIGVVPYGGFLFMPDKIFSLAFEARAPFEYESKIPMISTEVPSSGIYFNLLFSVTLILNFDLRFYHP